MAQAAGYSFNPDTIWTTPEFTKVRDLGGYFLHGTLTGSVALTAGKYDQGLNCTGGAMQIGVRINSYALDESGGLGFAAWVKLNTTTAAARCIASAKDDAGNLVWAFYASNASGNIEIKIGATTFSTTTSIRDGLWHHIVFSLNRVPATDTFKVGVDGTQVHNVTSTATFDYGAGNAYVEVGRNVVTTGEVLDGIVDDVRWWNDPCEPAFWPELVAAEQIPFMLGIYNFDDDTTNDFGLHGNDLVKHASASFADGIYGRALVCASGAAGATGDITFPDCDRLTITGWIRLDQAPAATMPILVITTAAGADRVRVRVNTDRTVSITYTTNYTSVNGGVFSATTSNALTVGAWTPIQVYANPTAVAVRHGNGNYAQTGIQSDPFLTPLILDLDKLYLGGDNLTGSTVSFSYLTLTKNHLAGEIEHLHFSGSPAPTPHRPGNNPVGVWNFNENTGASAADDSPNANTLTLTGSGGWTTGVEGSCLNALSSGPAASTTALTGWAATPVGIGVSMWARFHPAGSGARALVLRNGTTEVLHIGRLDGRLWIRAYDTTGSSTGLMQPTATYTFGLDTVADNTWLHIAVSFNLTASGGQQRWQFYRDARRYGEHWVTMPNLPVPTTLHLGSDGADSRVADIDDLRIFDRPIGPANIEWMYANRGVYYGGATSTVPENLTATAMSASQIDLSWDAVGAATGYDIERDGVVIATDHTSTTYSDTGLDPVTTYTYRVRSVL